MKNLFHPEGTLWRVLNVITDLFALSVIWFLCCLPIVTIGPATEALYDSVVHGIRYQDSGPYRRFFRTFRADFKISLPTSLLWTAVIGLGVWSMLALLSLGSSSRLLYIAAVAYGFFLLLPLGAGCWACSVLSRFTYNWKDLNLTALKLSVGYLPRTAGILLLSAGCLALCVRYLFPVTFLPACLMLGWSVLLEPVFTRHGAAVHPDNQERAEEEKKNRPEL